MKNLTNDIILITGADGGIGSALTHEFIKRGVKKVYVTGLSQERLDTLVNQYPDRIISHLLDVTKIESIQNCVTSCSDTTILINNAGVELKKSFLDENASQAALFEMKVNYLGVMDMIQQFLPILEKNEKSTIVNILSIGSLAISKRLGTYCATKTAAHLLTESIREELSLKNIHVSGVYMGYVNTQMVTEETKTKKSEPSDIAIGICNGIEQNLNHIFPDEMGLEFVKQNPIKTHYFD